MLLHESNFTEEIAGKVALVDFWAPWCGPCNALTPTIVQLEEEFKDRAVVGKVNVSEETALATAYDISAIPAIIFFKDGEPVERLVGLQDANTLKTKLEALLND